MGTSKNPVVPANGHKGHAGPVSKFFKLLILPANLDPDPAQPLWLFAGETILGFLEVPHLPLVIQQPLLPRKATAISGK